jgi:glutamine amidotransferase
MPPGANVSRDGSGAVLRIDEQLDEPGGVSGLSMCRLFGMSAGRKPARATFWLLEAPDSLATQSHREPDGTGLGWFGGDGAPHVSKQPIAAYGDAEFAREAHEVSSRTFIAHIRFASTGALDLLNTHPFEQDGRLFAHNGVIENLHTLEAHLGDDRRLVKGDTDSERFFALITREIAARNGDVAAGIEAACAWVAANLPLFAINFVLASADGLWALRYPETHDLYLLERAAGAPLEHSSSLGSRVRSTAGADRPLVVLASERMDTDPSWRLLASGELLHITPTLEVSPRRILEHPPARLLTLNDLSPGAQASQAHTANAPHTA